MSSNIRRPAVYLAFMAMPFTSVFSITSQVSLSVVVFSFAVLILICGGDYVSLGKDKVSRIIVSLALIGIPAPVIAVLTSIDLHHEIRYGHLLARTLFYFLILGGVVYIIALAHFGASRVKKIVEWTYFATLGVSIVDALNLFGVMDFKLPRAAVDELIVPYVDLYRIRGPLEEPSYLGAFVAATLPIYLHTSVRRVRTFFLVSCVTILFTLSANFVIWSFVYLVVWCVLVVARSRLSGIINAENLLRILFLAVLIAFAIFQFDVLGIVHGKFVGNSFDHRVESYSIVSEFGNRPQNLVFGFGPGFFLSTNFSQPTSIFVSTLVELGLVGLFVFLAIYFINVVMLVRNREAMHLAVGCFSFLIYFVTTPAYYYPFYALPLLYWTLFKASLMVPSKAPFCRNDPKSIPRP